MKRLLVAMAIAAACTGSREESRTPAAQGAPPAEASPAPIAAPAPIAEPSPRSDAGVGAQVGKDACCFASTIAWSRRRWPRRSRR